MYYSILVPILPYGHEFWIMTERVRSQMQAFEIKFLRKIKGGTMFDRVRNAVIRESLDIDSLLLCIERSQLRWFDNVSRMFQERLPSKLYLLKRMRRSQLDNHEQDGLIIWRILVGTVWHFVQAKCSLCWWIERCGGLIWSCCCPRNPLEKAREEKKKRRILLQGRKKLCEWHLSLSR